MHILPQKISTKKWPKNDLRLHKIAQKWPKIAQIGQKLPKIAKMAQKWGGLPDLLQYYMGGGRANLLQYYMGGGSSETPKLYYVIYEQPLII